MAHLGRRSQIDQKEKARKGAKGTGPKKVRLSFSIDRIGGCMRGSDIVKWFKHYSNAHKGSAIQVLMPEFGKVQAYGLYFLLVEYLSDKWDGSEAPRFKVFKNELRSFLGLKQKKLSSFLVCLHNERKISLEETEDFFIIEFPKLLEIRHRDALSAGARLETGQHKSGVEEEEIRKEEKKRRLASFANFLKTKISLITQDTWNTKYGPEFVLEHGAEAYSFFSNDPSAATWSTMTWVSKISSSLDRAKGRAVAKANERTGFISGVVPD